VGRKCNTYGKGGVHTVFWWGDLIERDHLKDRSANGRIILKWIFDEWDGGTGEFFG
jgi:hypothetical protein